MTDRAPVGECRGDRPGSSTRRPERAGVASTDLILGVVFSPDGRRLASASWDGTARLWDLATRRQLASWRAHLLGVNSVTFTPDGRRLVAGTGDGFIKLWNTEDGHEVLTLTASPDVNTVSFMPQAETLGSVSLGAL